MTASTFTFSGDKVALIVRGKTSHTHTPGKLEQHADCILSNGAPIGFYGEGNDGSGNSSGLGMDGIVYDYSALLRKRAPYVDAGIARGTGSISTVLFVQVSAAEAAAFDKAWADMTSDPGSFQILGWNCSTHASQAFRKAGILAGGIPGLDTPDNLYRQLCVEKASKLSVISGYVGFSAFGKGYMLTVDTP
jgi:hypothetical protein